jgi:toxin ParE1/3/4
MAEADLAEAASFIARDSARYAKQFVRDAQSTARTLPRFPQRGRIVPEFERPDLRELIVGRYRMVYVIRADSVEIVTVIDGARDLMPHIGSL